VVTVLVSEEVALVKDDVADVMDDVAEVRDDVAEVNDDVTSVKLDAAYVHGPYVPVKEPSAGSLAIRKSRPPAPDEPVYPVT